MKCGFFLGGGEGGGGGERGKKGAAKLQQPLLDVPIRCSSSSSSNSLGKMVASVQVSQRTPHPPRFSPRASGSCSTVVVLVVVVENQ